MDFSWIKNLFKKKTNENINLTTIDTTLTCVSEFKKLKRQEKEKVLKYFNSINLDNYRDIVKYSDDLSKLYSLEQDVLLHTMWRYEQDFKEANEMINKSKKNEPIAMIKKSVAAKLQIYEYGVIFNNIYTIRKDLEYRFIALNLFIHKYDKLCLSKSITKEEKQKYLSKRGSLDSQSKLMLISIRDVDNVLGMVRDNIKKDVNIEESHELVNNYNTILNNDRDIFLNTHLRIEIGIILRRIQYLFKHSSLLDPFIEEIKKEILDKMENEMQKKRNKLIDLHHKVWTDLDIQRIQNLKYDLKVFTNTSTHVLVNSIPSKYLEDLYKIIAKYMHKHEIYYNLHKKDYEIYIKEMNEIYNQYRITPTKEWDINDIKGKMDYYEKERDAYFELYKDYLTPDMIDKINDAFYRLCWLYSLISIEAKKFDNVSEKEMNNIVQIYLKYSSDLLLEVEDKFNVKLNNSYIKNKKQIALDRYNFVFANTCNRRCSLFFDLLNGYDDDINIYLPEGYNRVLDDLFSTPNGDEIHQRLMNIDRSHLSDHSYNIYQKLTNASLEELFYLLKFLKIDNYKLDRTTLLRMDEQSGRSSFTNFVASVMLKKYEEKYDDRIMIIPKIIYINWAYNHEKERLIPYTANTENRLACFVQSCNALCSFLLCSQQFYKHYKYLFISENAYNEYKRNANKHEKNSHYKKRYGNPWNNIIKNGIYYEELLTPGEDTIFDFDNIKIIIVPDNTKYSELTNYLDQELEKEHNNEIKKELVI